VYRKFVLLKVLGIMIDPAGGHVHDHDVKWRPAFIE
jgi:hypothetical protein